MKGIPRALSPRQAETLQLIIKHLAGHNFPPTHRELAMQLGVTSTNAVSDLLKGLERKGYIERARLLSRGIRVVRTP